MHIRFFTAFWLFFGIGLSVSAQVTTSQVLAKKTVDAYRPDLVLNAFLKDSATAPSVRSDLSDDAKLLSETDWKSAIPKLDELYAQKFSQSEQEALAAFFETSAGKKYLASRAEVLSRLMVHAVAVKREADARTQLDKAIRTVLRESSDAGRAEIEEAIKAQPIATDNLLGRWYSKDGEDGVYNFVGSHLKREDGANVSAGVWIDHQDKTYDKFEEPGIWEIRGRLVIELNFSDTEWANLFILDKLSPEKLIWRVVDPYAEPQDWIVSEETRKPIPFPPKPAGYQDAEK